jgi:hypothetical protein
MKFKGASKVRVACCDFPKVAVDLIGLYDASKETKMHGWKSFRLKLSYVFGFEISENARDCLLRECCW